MHERFVTASLDVGVVPADDQRRAGIADRTAVECSKCLVMFHLQINGHIDQLRFFCQDKRIHFNLLRTSEDSFSRVTTATRQVSATAKGPTLHQTHWVVHKSGCWVWQTDKWSSSVDCWQHLATAGVLWDKFSSKFGTKFRREVLLFLEMVWLP